jgi:hypothetical protein
MIHALATVAQAGAPERFVHLAAEAATPGGLNEQAEGMLRTGGAFQHVGKALDAILTRISQPPATSRKPFCNAQQHSNAKAASVGLPLHFKRPLCCPQSSGQGAEISASFKKEGRPV